MSTGLLDAAIEAAAALGMPLWLVGGAVRDAAVGLPVRNVDVSVEGDAAVLAEAVARRVSGELSRFPRFGTATVQLGVEAPEAPEVLDVASTRIERYARSAALPAVEQGATIEQDLARRDFSVNAIALAVSGVRSGEIVDPCEGLADLAAGRLRVLHDRSFVDDPTRLWRAARYSARLGLRPDAATATLIARDRHFLRHVSGVRIRGELARTAAERRVAATLGLLDGWGVLAASAPGLALAPATARALRHRPGPHGAALLLALLLAPLPDRAHVLHRLSPTRDERRAVEHAVRLLTTQSVDVAVLELLEGMAAEGRRAALWLDPGRQRPLQQALARWERARPPLDAAALLRLGVTPAVAVGEWLRRLRRERYLGNLSSAATARRLVRAAQRPDGD
ncbi:MAG: hypothetical protein QF664_03510 [Dehalococcoidia bacterium]|nr:hypothetical protein [Dehalococcoidia bacterium]